MPLVIRANGRVWGGHPGTVHQVLVAVRARLQAQHRLVSAVIKRMAPCLSRFTGLHVCTMCTKQKEDKQPSPVSLTAEYIQSLGL